MEKKAQVLAKIWQMSLRELGACCPCDAVQSSGWI